MSDETPKPAGDKPKPKRRPRPLPLGIEVVYEDRDVLVINKPAGLLSMGTEKVRERTAYFFMMDYVRKGNPKSHNRVFIVHRLDRETSGLLLLAKSEQAQRKLQDNWESVEKRYAAVVRGKLPAREGTITSYLAENVTGMMYSTDDRKRGKLAETHYRVVKQTAAMSLVDVRLLTGRKNQIRVHMADSGCPIAGDKKYGQKKDPVKRLALHAGRLEFAHPHSGKPVICEIPLPPLFEHLVGQIK